MKANTLKIEDPLLGEINKMRPPDQSFSAYVRLLLKQAVRREKMAHAAEQYAQLLKDEGEEREWQDEWESADLASSPHGKTSAGHR